jgi:hypothetical protein
MKLYIHDTKLPCSLYIHFLIILISASSYRVLKICIFHLINRERNNKKLLFCKRKGNLAAMDSFIVKDIAFEFLE